MRGTPRGDYLLLKTQFQPLTPTKYTVHRILVWLVYFVKRTNRSIKKESNKDWIDRQSLRKILWGKTEGRHIKKPAMEIDTNTGNPWGVN